MKLKKKTLWLIIFGVFILALFLAWFIFFSGTNNELKTTPVVRQDVLQDVFFTGRLYSTSKAQIAFEYAGTVTQVSVDVGDVVSKGDVLMRLDSRASQLELARANADRASAIDAARISWDGAEKIWDATRNEQSATIEKYKEAVRNAKDDLDQAKVVWEQTVRESGDESSTAKTKYSAVLSAQSVYESAQKTLSQAQSTADKTILSARESADSAYASYVSTQQASQSSSGVSSLGATQALSNLRLAKSVILAPFDGVVTARDIESGEVAGAGVPVVTVETIDSLELKADVPESDIAKLSRDMLADFTLDAYSPADEWHAHVVDVAPSAKILEGVPTYEVTLALDTKDERHRPGMTANVVVHSAVVKNAISLPRRVLAREGSKYFVQVVISGDVQTREVEVGLVGSDGFVEILNGVNEGDEVVLSTPSAS